MLLLRKHSEATRVRILWECLLTSRGFTSFSRRALKCFPRFLFQTRVREARFTKFNLKPTENSPKTHFVFETCHAMKPTWWDVAQKPIFRVTCFFIAPFHEFFPSDSPLFKEQNIQKRSVIKSLKMILENLTTFIMCKHFQLIQISGMEWIRRFLLVSFEKFCCVVEVGRLYRADWLNGVHKEQFKEIKDKQKTFSPKNHVQKQ